jgi:hypothetical protein
MYHEKITLVCIVILVSFEILLDKREPTIGKEVAGI